MKLYKHQEEFLEKNPDRHLLCWSMGTGKSRTAVEWAKKRDGVTLIVVPKGLVDNWVRECEKWSFDDYVIISKEKFKKLVAELPKYDNIIIDEAHYFAGKSQMNKAMDWYINKRDTLPNVLCLTGTPYMRNAWNVYRIGHLLGKKNEWKWHAFNVTFFNMVRMGYRTIPVQKTDVYTKKALASLVNEIGSTKTLEECADVPVCQEYIETVERTKEQVQGLIDIKDFEPIVRFTKEHQITGGFLLGDEYTPDKTFKSNKLDRLTELVGTNSKVAVVCRYRHEIKMLAKHFEKLKRQVFVLYGDVKNRDEVIQSARKSDDCVLIIGAQLSEGWEIPEIETMIFYSHDFSLKNYVQMKGRIQRINDLRQRCYIHLAVKDSVDEGVYKSLLQKRDFLIHIYAQERSTAHHTT